MVSDTPSWIPSALKLVLDRIGVTGEVLCAMTTAERIQLFDYFKYDDKVGAMAEAAVCSAPDELKDHTTMSKYRHEVEELLNTPLPPDYDPAEVDIVVTDVPENAEEAGDLSEEAKDGFTADEDDTALSPPTEPEFGPANPLAPRVATTEAPSTAVSKVTPPKRSDLETSYVGIVNQGGTCYLNSTVQVLFHLPKFRDFIYNIRVTDEAAPEFALITTALQNLFLSLQTRKSSISTVELTKSFGWNVRDAHEQHDAHEMIQRLLEAFEMITKGTPAKETLHKLFYGKQLNYVRCLDVDYVSRNPADFFDLELITLNNDSMEKSLEAKVRPEKLDGEYKREYEDGREPTKHPAEMGSVFLSLPPVLFVHPSRVDFCMQTFQRKMVDTPWRFSTKVNFSRYVAKDPEHGTAVVNDGTGEDDPNLDYELHSLIMHQGTPFSGHYMAYARFENRWLKFNDTVVTEVDEESVLRDAFSEPLVTTDRWGCRSSRSSYTRASVLVYIRSNMRDELVFPISDTDLPDALHENLKLKAEREEKAKIEAEIKARQVGVRYLVGDRKGEYLSKVGLLTGRDCPIDKVEMDKDIAGSDLGQRLAEVAGVPFDEIEDLWLYPEYYWPSSTYYAPKKVEATATAGDLAKGWVFIALKQSHFGNNVDRATIAEDNVATSHHTDVAHNGNDEAEDDSPAPMVKESTQEILPTRNVSDDATTEESGLGSSESTAETGYMNILGDAGPLVLPLKKFETATTKYSNLPALLPLCVFRKNALEYVGLCRSVEHVVEVVSAMESSLVDDEQIREMVGTKRERTKPIRAHQYNDGLYGDDEQKDAARVEEEEVVLEFEDMFSFCFVEKNQLRNVKLRAVHGGAILIAYASTIETQKIANAYDMLCNPLNITVFQLDDALTPEELCELTICPSFTYDQLQVCVFEAMSGSSVPLLNPVRRMPKSKDQIGFRCHDDKTDRPHKTMMLSDKNKYGEKHTAQSILSNRGSFMITKLYVEVLPDVISIPELDGHGNVCDIPLHLGYFYHRHFYMKEGRLIPLYEVFRVCMAQQLAGLPEEFKERVEKRWLASQAAFLENRAAFARDSSVDQICKLSSFDPVFRLVRMGYGGTSVYSEHYDWEAPVNLDTYYDYVVDLLPADITKVNWTKYDVNIVPQVKPMITFSVASPEPIVSPLLSSETLDPTPSPTEDGSRVEEACASPKSDAEAVVASNGDDAITSETAKPAEPADSEPPTEQLQPEAKSEVSEEINTTENKATTEPSTTEKTNEENDNDNPLSSQPLLIEDRKNSDESEKDNAGMTPSASFPESLALGWYQLFHGDRRYTDAIYGLVTTVVLPLDSSLTGAELMDIILRQIGVMPGEDVTDEANASGSPSAVSSPASTGPRVADTYANAKKTWKLVFKGRQTKVLEPNMPYEKIEKDVGKVDYIMLDHPQSTKARVLSRHQRSEQAIRISIIASETERMKHKHSEEKKTVA